VFFGSLRFSSDGVAAALQEKHKAKVVVVNNRQEALKALLETIPKGASISAAGSHTLTQVCFEQCDTPCSAVF
jgi:shikimate 5-dehydrogenase